MTKRKRTSDERNKKDKLSDLPYVILLHIMEFLSTKQAVQSCVLSKRWKNLWKSLNTLSFRSSTAICKYNKSVSHVLSNRDYYVSLHNLHLTVFSACTSLTTLVLRHSMHNSSAQTLHIFCPMSTPNFVWANKYYFCKYKKYKK